MFRYLVLIAGIVAAANAYSTGAPDGVCNDLTPKHHAEPQSEPSPYKIIVDKESAKAGDEVTVTLEGKTKADKIKGFVIQARDKANNAIVGSFDVDANDANVQTMDCPGGTKNSVTHKNSDDKESVSVKWLASSDVHGTVGFVATIVKEGSTFWVGEKSTEVAIRH